MVDQDKDQKFLSRAEKTTSTPRSIFRIIFGICAFLFGFCWEFPLPLSILLVYRLLLGRCPFLLEIR
jgi:hypothetical protein